jgi:hypothetical protein
MRISLLVLLALTLVACQTTEVLPVTSPYYLIPVGSRLVLNKPIEIAPTSATVRLQFGKIVSRWDSQDFEPLCVFESRIVGEKAQVIEPDSFEIIRVRRDYNPLSAQAEPHARPVGSFGGNGGARFYYKTELFLRSDKQPQILVMTCQHAWETGSSGLDLRPLTVEEIRQALGTYFTLQLAGV